MVADVMSVFTCICVTHIIPHCSEMYVAFNQLPRMTVTYTEKVADCCFEETQTKCLYQDEYLLEMAKVYYFPDVK